MPTQPDEAGNTRKGLSQEAPIVVGQIVSDLHKDLLFDGQVRLVLAPNHKHHPVALLSAFLDELDEADRPATSRARTFDRSTDHGSFVIRCGPPRAARNSVATRGT